MDADVKVKRRDRISQRENRWSMNSQRLEKIVAELMKPISDVRQSFDTDLCMLLEEYLTEAGLHALGEGEGEDSEGEGAVRMAAPNFAELALLLQQSANIYSRKVDFLYQHVLSVSNSLHNSTSETSNEPGEPSTSNASRRKRKSSTCVEFVAIELEASGAASRAGRPRAPPVLPRAHAELAPRAPAPGDLLLADLRGEPLGLLHDFHVAWRLMRGELVDDLEGSGEVAECALRRLPLLELQAALAAAAPRDPPPARSPASPPAPSPPSPAPPSPAPASPPPALPPPDKRERKRKSDVKIDDVTNYTTKLLLTEEGRRRMRVVCEFRLPGAWVRRVVRARVAALRRERAAWAARADVPAGPFRGFDSCGAARAGGFAGWPPHEAAAAREHARARRRDLDSDDDGFFEQSSLGDSDASRTEEPAGEQTPYAAGTAGTAGATRGPGGPAGRALDVRSLAARVLAALPPGRDVPVHVLLKRTIEHQTDVSRIFLATLFLANAGSVSVVPGPALATGAWAVRAAAAGPAGTPGTARLALCSPEEEALLR